MVGLNHFRTVNLTVQAFHLREQDWIKTNFLIL
jgi:hypothetical protein